MVRRLEKKGRNVRFFGMINSFAPDRKFWGNVETFSVETELAFIRGLPGHEGFIESYGPFKNAGELWRALIQYYEERHVDTEEFRTFVYDDMDRAIPGFHSVGIQAAEILYYVNVLRTFDNVRALYEPSGKVRAQCHFFKAVRERAANIEKWNDFCERELIVHEIDGDNFSVIRYPAVHNLAGKLDKILAESEKTTCFFYKT